MRTPLTGFGMLLVAACGQRSVTTSAEQREVEWLRNLESQSSCKTVTIPFEYTSGIKDRNQACILTAAALRFLRDSVASVPNLTMADASNILRAEVSGAVTPPLREGDEEWRWWNVYLQSASFSGVLSVNFDRHTRVVSVGVCSECRPRY